MNNFLYCLDSNYNIPASCSIYSLLEKSKEEVNIFIMHKDTTNEDFLPKKVIEHPKLNKLSIHNVDLTDYNFPNLLGTHVSEATYYRLFIQDYVKQDIDYLTYIDCDAFFLNDPGVLIKESIQKMRSSGFTISSMSELGLEHHSSKILKLKSEKYFNAGVMIIDLNKWKSNDLKNSSLKIMKEYKEKLLFWDQDILNLYFDGQYEPLPSSLNFKIDMDIDNKALNITNGETQEILIIHYSGKFKPWSVRGAVNYNAEYFQEIYRSIYAKKYYLNVNYKKNAINDILSSISNRSLFSAKHPFSLIWYTIKALIKL